MFAVFYNGEFIDWWLNPPSDSTWIERTIAAKGWTASLLTVLWFNNRPDDSLKYEFDLELNRINFIKENADMFPVLGKLIYSKGAPVQKPL